MGRTRCSNPPTLISHSCPFVAAMDDDCDDNDNDVDGDQSSLPSADYNGRPRSEFFIHSDDRE